MNKKQTPKCSMSPGPEHIFQQLELQISQLHEHIEHLLKLGQFMGNGFFDDEDKKMILSKISEAQQVKQGLEKTLVEKQHIYNNHVRVMETQLVSRRNALEQFDKDTGLFKIFPDVLDYFAKKQTRLQGTLQTIKQQLKE